MQNFNLLLNANENSHTANFACKAKLTPQKLFKQTYWLGNIYTWNLVSTRVQMERVIRNARVTFSFRYLNSYCQYWEYTSMILLIYRFLFVLWIKNKHCFRVQANPRVKTVVWYHNVSFIISLSSHKEIIYDTFFWIRFHIKTTVVLWKSLV